MPQMLEAKALHALPLRLVEQRQITVAQCIAVAVPDTRHPEMHAAGRGRRQCPGWRAPRRCSAQAIAQAAIDASSKRCATPVHATSGSSWLSDATTPMPATTQIADSVIEPDHRRARRRS